jgi:nitrite reductase/ring-hydroxylating ferredoxin subunit
VKVEGRFYAFQEFCTHRFGPMSEGKLANGHVQCPWHRSCFDVRTGKVVHGPAKIDLKTYPVRIENGKLCIELKPAFVASRV